MPLARRFAALLLLVLWLPALLHCRLEAAGISLVATCCDDDHRAAASAGCTRDACEMLEDGFLKPSGNDLDTPAPVALACFCCLIGIAPEPIIVPTVSPEGAPCPPELARTWQFVARAALSPRAP